MRVHGNARTTPHGRRLLVRRVLAEGWSIAQVARAAGISERVAYRWLARWRSGDHELVDRSSRPCCSPRRTPQDRVVAVLALRRLWFTASEISDALSMPLSTVSLVLKRAGLGRRSALIPREQQRRYERSRPGELVHIDIKKLAAIRGAGHAVSGTRAGQPRREGGDRIGYQYLHVCVDDATRIAYAEILPDETTRSAIRFLVHALRYYRSLGIQLERVMTDNGSAYRSHLHAALCRMLGLRHLRTRPRRPQTNGKAERFIRTILEGWAYGAIYGTSHERQNTLPAWLHFYNHRRPHSSLNRQTPHERLTNLLGNYS